MLGIAYGGLFAAFSPHVSGPHWLRGLAFGFLIWLVMMLAFLPLCVIPELKLTDFGLVRYNPPDDQAPVLIGDQRGSRRPAFQ